MLESIVECSITIQAHKMNCASLRLFSLDKQCQEMEYCASAASMLAEVIFHLQKDLWKSLQIRMHNLGNVEEMFQIINIMDCHSSKVKKVL